MALSRVGNQGHLSMENKYAQVQSPTRCSRTKTAAKTRKIEKTKKLRKPGCHTRQLPQSVISVSKVGSPPSEAGGITLPVRALWVRRLKNRFQSPTLGRHPR